MRPHRDDDVVVRMVTGEASVSPHDLADPAVAAALTHVVRALAAEVARSSGESPTDVVRRLLHELHPVPAAPPVLADDERGLTLLRIGAMARSGKSSYTIAAALNSDGVPSPAGRRWHRRAVEALLTEALRAADDDTETAGETLHATG